MAAKDESRRPDRNAESVERRVVIEQDAERQQSQDKDTEHGEGNYKAAREFDEAERAFVHSDKLKRGIDKIKPSSDAEARELIDAEEKARERAKEEDPALLKRRP